MVKSDNILKGLTTEQLTADLAVAREQYQRMKFGHAVVSIENNSLIKNKRRDIARLLTELRAREVGSMTDAQLARRSKMRQRRRSK